MTKPQFFSTGWLCGLAIVACTALGVARFSHYGGDVATSIAATTQGSDAGTNNGSEKLTLPQEEREFLWQVEHHGMVLGKFGFRPLADSLARQDTQGVAKHLAADFRGQMPDQPREVRVKTDYVQAVRLQDAGQPSSELNAPQFADKLLAFRRHFHAEKPPKVSFSLITLLPVVREDFSGLWQGSCLLRMWGEVAAGQPGEVLVILQFRTVRPTEESLGQSGWLRFAGIVQSQVSEAPRFLLRDATKERGIKANELHDNWTEKANKTTTGGVYLCDFDRDGIMDMLVTDLNRYTLYKGKPDGTFEDVTLSAGLPMTSVANTQLKIVAGFIDIDGDGWEDLILGNQIFRNEKGRFVNYTHRCNFRPSPDAVGYAIADYDRDGRPDIYVLRAGKSQTDSWLEGRSGDPRGNELWHNLGNWQFEEVATKAGAEGGHRSTFSAVWLDANNDGWPDLYVINEFGNGVLLVNQGNGTFREHLLATGPADFGSMGVTCGDIDNDGNIDLYIGNMYSKAGKRVIGNLKPGIYPNDVVEKMKHFVVGSQLWHNRGQLKFDPIGEKCQVASVGWAYGADLIDLDNDGWLDLYATCGFMSKDRSEPDG